MEEDSNKKKRSRCGCAYADAIDEPPNKKVLANSIPANEPSGDDEVVLLAGPVLDVLPMFVVEEDIESLECDDRYGNCKIYDSLPKCSFRIHPKLSLQAAVNNLEQATAALTGAILAVNEAKKVEESVRNGAQSFRFKRMVVDGIDKITSEQVVVTLYKKRGDEQPLLTYNLSNWTPTITLKED